MEMNIKDTAKHLVNTVEELTEEKTKMNIYEKLQAMRVELENLNLKKTGKNTYVGYDYFEQGDFLPELKKLMNKYKTTSVISFTKEEAIFRLIDCEKPESFIVFPSPIAEVTLKGAHAVQNLGAIQTYLRRYLYINVFDIVENDVFDKEHGKIKENPVKQQLANSNWDKPKPATPPINQQNCQKCGALMKTSKAGNPYCSAKCWLNQPQQIAPEPTPTPDEEIYIEDINF